MNTAKTTKAEPETKPSALELSWRAERESMGKIEIPELQCAVLRESGRPLLRGRTKK